ncbi:pilus assembly PilX family protein [Neisseria musculi]|uniref:PilX N-terminal family protein n=1 Tax=Neisseria musculi TaxID=1815583 RepID=A0A7H1ME05_9NEIS|nr:pilus assembly protein [Neisseria musculi]QNT59870.1 pilX family domain protein [Neisseria musculi]
MRQPQPFVTFKPKSAQQGFSLFIVLMVMIVVAFLVVSVTQSYNTEQRISTNDADHKFATALAEAALRTGEKRIADDDLDASQFTEDCENALCNVGTNPAWERATCGKSKTESCIDNSSGIFAAREAAQPSRYIIEYISQQPDGSEIYRVTAKAWGKNRNTVVILQSYVAAGK